MIRAFGTGEMMTTLTLKICLRIGGGHWEDLKQCFSALFPALLLCVNAVLLCAQLAVWLCPLPSQRATVTEKVLLYNSRGDTNKSITSTSLGYKTTLIGVVGIQGSRDVWQDSITAHLLRWEAAQHLLVACRLLTQTSSLPALHLW